MAAGESYPANIIDGNGNVKEGVQILFTDSTDQPLPNTGGELSGTDLALTGLTGSVTAVRYVGGTATVAPTTGAHSVGDVVVSVNGHMWICTSAGTPGTWVELGSLLASLTVAVGATSLAALTASGVVSLSNASISMAGLPTSDPAVTGRLWRNSGVVTVSA